ncbi:MAG TPA: adenylyl-sulfate kinase [Williamwhitmania sp.]|nr:adenylyl-sulfate kinase [Williamwhitmania sp.]
MVENIFPVFKGMLEREVKENRLKQRGVVVWLTGLSGSGKTSIAIAVEQELSGLGFLTQILDGDNIRAGLNSNLGFTAEDRLENIRRIAETAKLFAHCGVITICCFVSPEVNMREKAKQIIGEGDFYEVFVNTSMETCEQRDVKGLYKKAREGKIEHFTGVNAPFEAPLNPFLELKTEGYSVMECASILVNAMMDRIKLK